jgi:hypothetical protein
MTIAEIRGKISETGSNLSERMEDLLTSDIFGCFRYLPPEEGLIPFLETTESLNGNSLNLDKPITNISYSFWPYMKTLGCNPCEPDLLLGLENESGVQIILIEAKYYSGLSSEEDVPETPPNNQLARELDNLNSLSRYNHGGLSNNQILSRSLVFVTQDMKIPKDLLARSLREYKLKRGNQGDIFWTSWRFLPSILERLLVCENNNEHRAVLEDMLLLLQKKWLTMFEGVEPVAFENRITDFDFYRVASRKYKWPIIPEASLLYAYHK